MEGALVMKKSLPAWMLLVACLALDSCSFFRARPSTPPVSSVFPLEEESRILYDGEINRLVRNSGGRLYFSTLKGVLVSVDVPNKKVAWTFSARAGASAPPCLGASRIYFADVENTVYCLDETGALVWEKKLSEQSRGDFGVDTGKLILATEAGNILALDALTGEEAWRFNAESPVQSGPTFWNRQIVFGTEAGKLLFLGPDGKRLAAFTAGAALRGPLFIHGDRLFYSLQNGTFNCFNLVTRKRRWKIQTGGFMSALPVADQKRIFFLNSNSALFCLDKKRGELLWWKSIPARDSFGLETRGEEILASSLSPLWLGFYRRDGEKSGSYDAGQELKSNALVLDSQFVINLYDREAGRGILAFLKRGSVAPENSQKKIARKETER